jgi:hypothetical protein
MRVSNGAARPGVGDQVGAGILREGQTGKHNRQGKDRQRFDGYSHSCFSSPMFFVPKHWLQMALRFQASREGLGRGRTFLPEATNRNASSR